VDTSDPGAGARFDSFHGNYATLYGGSDQEACFAECLARFRPKPELADLVRQEWHDLGFMGVGSVPADWRASRVLVRLQVESALPYVDVTSAQTVAALQSNERITRWLHSFLGNGPVDLGDLMGRDRRVTRLVSQWAYEEVDAQGLPLYGGIRYVSRLGANYECWALFEGANVIETERHSLSHHNRLLCEVAARYGIHVH
jgi:hypothetical protein